LGLSLKLFLPVFLALPVTASAILEFSLRPLWQLTAKDSRKVAAAVAAALCPHKWQQQLPTDTNIQQATHKTRQAHPSTNLQIQP
jgi:hypothetical protein